MGPTAKSVVLRVVLPVGLGAGALLRPSLLSLVYGLLALLSPALPSVTALGTPKATKAYVSLCLGLTLLGSLAQAAFQIAAAVGDASDFAPSCVRDVLAGDLSGLGDVLFHLGLQPVSGASEVRASRILLSDLVPLLASLVALVVVVVLKGDGAAEDEGSFDVIAEEPATEGGPAELSWGERLAESALKSTDVAAVVVLGLMGTLAPSILNLVYFLGFLALLSWWGLYSPAVSRAPLNRAKALLLIYAAFHIALEYLYQLPAFNRAKPLLPGEETARLAGLWQMYKFGCSSGGAWQMELGLEGGALGPWLWQKTAAPFVLVAGYFALAYQLRLTLNGTQPHTRGPRRTRDDNSSLHEELLRSEEEMAAEGAGAGAGAGAVVQLGVRAAEWLVGQAWALSLLAMIAWAIVYHSGLAFILLIVSCALWSFPSTTKATYALSPLIVIYAEILLLLQYMYSLDFPDDSPAPFAKGEFNVWIRDLGFYVIPQVATCLPLWLKSFLSLPLFLTMRVRFEQKMLGSLSPAELRSKRGYGTFAAKAGPKAEGPEVAVSETSLAEARGWLTNIFGKYFIFVVVGVLLVVSVRPGFAVYSLGYLLFFLALITLLQLSFAAFRRLLFCVLSLVLLYAGLNIIWVYAFQFNSVCDKFKNSSNASVHVLLDLGVDCKTGGERIGASLLLTKMLTPLSVLFVVVLQCKFFHNIWMAITDPSQTHTEPAAEAGLKGKAKRWLGWATETLWRGAEIHWWKVVCFSFACVCAYEVSAMNAVLMLLLCLILPGRIAQPLLFLLASLWLSLVVLVKEAFQLHSIEPEAVDAHFPCASEFWGNKSVSEWVGFRKTNAVDKEVLGWDIARYVAGVTLALLALAVEGVVRARMGHWRRVRGLEKPARPLLLPGKTHASADDDLRSMLAFLANFFFYKFGLEICLTTTMVVAAVRLDFLALVYVVFLLGLFWLPRRTLRVVWWPYVFVLAILFGLQYAVCLGLPCVKYLWDDNTEDFPEAAVKWFYLPSVNLKANSKYLLADFFQLLFAACQAVVFGLEGEDEEGGSNEEIWRRDGGVEAAEANPYHDFMSDNKSVLDIAKQAFFAYFQWVTLIMIFVAGLGAISVFAFIYLIAAFLFLWKGNDLYLKPGRWVMGKWRAFTILVICVVVCKVALQIVGCVYLERLMPPPVEGGKPSTKFCWLVQLFSIACFHPDMKTSAPDSCGITDADANLKFDVVAFVFLLVQLRILGSYYFRHVVDELRAERILSSRGAVLINTLIRQEMGLETEREARRIRDIKAKAAAIRRQALDQAQKKRELGPQAFDPHLGTYYDPQNYAAAKRAGDRWMFAGDPDAEENLPVEAPPAVPEVEPGASDFGGRDPIERIHDLVQSDLDFSRTDVSKEGREKSLSKEREGSEGLEPPPFAEEEEEEAAKPSAVAAALSWSRETLYAGLDWLTAFFNRQSRDHRYVAYALDQEKKKLKNQISTSMEASRLNGLEISRKSIREFREELLEGEASEEILYSLKTEEEVEELASDAEAYWKRGNPFSRLFVAVGMLLLSHTELICYLMMFLNHARTAAILSLPLPLLALLWGSLSSPRPAKFFWIVVIAYTEGLVVVKFLFQFNFFMWGAAAKNNDPFWPPRIIGIEQQPQFAAYDVALLICLFFHRYMLRKLGLWKDAQHVAASTDPDQSDTSHTGLLDRPSDTPNGDAHPDSLELKEIRRADDNVITEEPSDEKEAGGWLSYLGCCGSFYYRLIHPPFRYIRDMYPLMFLADLLCFAICVVRYPDFGLSQGGGDVVEDVKSNRIPLAWVVMLLTLTILIILDRGLYLRKAVTLKLLFQYFLVVFIHVYLFFVLPSLSETPVAGVGAIQAFYFIKCVYFLFSAWQIRNGYPTQVVGNLLTRKPDLSSFGLFSVFFFVPFLFEIRTLIDWIWTDTSMPLFDFFAMENFYAVIFKTKCGREIERRFPAERGVAKGTVVKYAMGGGMLLAVLILVFLPLLLYSLLNYIGEQALPVTVTFTATISGYPALYSMIAQRSYLQTNSSNYKQIETIFGGNKATASFVGEYSVDDVQFVRFRHDSLVTWDISPPSLDALKSDLERCSKQPSNEKIKPSEQLYITFKWHMTRKAREGALGVEHGEENAIRLAPNMCAKFWAVLNGQSNSTGEQEYIKIEEAYPPYVLLPSEGATSTPSQLYNSWSWKNGSKYRTSNDKFASAYSGLKMKLENAGGKLFWQAFGFNVDHNSTCPKPSPKLCNTTQPGCCQFYGMDTEDFYMVEFVTKLFPSFLSAVVKGGIIAVYVTVVLVAGKVLRGLVVGSPIDVIIKEMPCVDRLFKICQDLYLVRESRDFAMEQDIFAKLIFLFRSPETLINWTRPPPEKSKDD